MKVSATWSETPAEPTRLAPRLNEHGAEILRDAGYSADEIAALVRDGVTKAAPGSRGLKQMDFALTANQESIRDAVGKNLRAFRRCLLAEEGQGGRLPADFHKALADAGWLGICIPEAVWRLGPRHHRSRDHDADDRGIRRRHVRRLRRAHERVRAQSRRRVRHARSSASACCRRSSPAREKSCFAVTEPNTGLNTTQLKTRAVRTGDKYVVNGQKVWISTAQVAEKILLLARTTPLEEVKSPTHGLEPVLYRFRPQPHRRARDREDGPQGRRLQRTVLREF